MNRIPAAMLVASLATATLQGAEAQSTIERVSRGPGGVEANADSFFPAISGNGQFVAFQSTASNLAPGGANGEFQIFVVNRRSGRTERVSVALNGRIGNDSSFTAALSARGRYVAFSSRATNLVPGDTNGFIDVFVRDRDRGITRRVSVGPGGTQPNEESRHPTLSADGRFVVFLSRATNLVPGGSVGWNVFVHDRHTRTTHLISNELGGGPSNSLSQDATIAAEGRFVAFAASGANLVPGDTNGEPDIFVHDRQTGTTQRVSVGSGGAQADGDSFGTAISANGRFIEFNSNASNLVPGDDNRSTDTFLHDRITGQTQRFSDGQGIPERFGFVQAHQALSTFGRFVLVELQSNLVPVPNDNFPDVYVLDRIAGVIRQASATPAGAVADTGAGGAQMAADGQVVVFISNSTNLVPGDTATHGDVYVRVLP